MSDEPVTTPSDDEKDPAWFRDQLAKKDDEISAKEKELNRAKVQLMERSFKDVGLDPTKGLGKAIAKEYDGEPTAEALRTFAIEEYEWEPPVEVAENPLAPEVAAAQQRVSSAVTNAESNPTSQIDLDIAQAEERGDFASTIQLKVNKFRQEQGI